LDVYPRERELAVLTAALNGADRWRGGGSADDLRCDDGSHPGVRNAEGHGPRRNRYLYRVAD